ncbi:MAG: alpha/beta fold hydrolase [Candidatus Hydrogenedentota bacterium]|nr:MAG: alpha/beta fold hydrolase [Candidatus Hydrogenedentota bacterium]
MPIIHLPQKDPPWIHKSSHLSTILPTLLRNIDPIYTHRTRFETKDNDFFDVDICCKASNKLDQAVILLHGLEGSSHSKYILGMAKKLCMNMDVYAMNHRGCSGEINRNIYSYHSGFTQDLKHLVEKLSPKYKQIFLIGFSLGGNILLKYLGENSRIPASVCGAVAFGVPVDLESSAFHLAKLQNRIYLQRFLRQLKNKVEQKKSAGLPIPNYDEIMKSKTFLEFDNLFTAPANGFQDSLDYWRSCSSKPLLSHICIPTLLVNPINDPFLPAPCYPTIEAAQSKYFFLSTPRYGGHIGFYAGNKSYFSEDVALYFLQNLRACTPTSS